MKLSLKLIWAVLLAGYLVPVIVFAYVAWSSGDAVIDTAMQYRGDNYRDQDGVAVAPGLLADADRRDKILVAASFPLAAPVALVYLLCTVAGGLRGGQQRPQPLNAGHKHAPVVGLVRELRQRSSGRGR